MVSLKGSQRFIEGLKGFKNLVKNDFFGHCCALCGKGVRVATITSEGYG
jgi:hypothetical protein